MACRSIQTSCFKRLKDHTCREHALMQRLAHLQPMCSFGRSDSMNAVYHSQSHLMPHEKLVRIWHRLTVYSMWQCPRLAILAEGDE